MMAGAQSIANEKREALVQALGHVAAGERDALQTVYDMTSAKLLGIILRILPEREIAEDVLQDVYLKVWRRAGRYDSSLGSPISWLAVIARNAAIDEYRRRPVPFVQGSDDALAQLADGSQPVDERLCDEERYEAVKRCIEELGADQRRSIRMAYFGGLSHSQLAEKVGVPLGTMKSWIRRGLKSLKACLGHG